MGTYQSIASALANREDATRLELNIAKGQKGVFAIDPAVGQLTNLTELVLTSDYTYSVSVPDEISALSKLEKLDLGGVIERADFISALIKLTTLKLRFDHSSGSLPDGIANLTNLTHLEVSNTGSLPDSIGALTQLTHLWLSSPKSQTLPETIGNLSALISLKIEYGRELTSLPQRLGELHSLTELKLDVSNKVTALPSNISGLKNLEKLTISNAVLGDLPEGFAELSALKNCTVQNCGITKIPSNLTSMSSIQKLNIRGNPFCYDHSARQNLRAQLNDTANKYGSWTKVSAGPALDKLDVALQNPASCTEIDLSELAGHYSASAAASLQHLEKIKVPSGDIPSTWTQVKSAELSFHWFSSAYGGSLEDAEKDTICQTFLNSHLAETVEDLKLPKTQNTLGPGLQRWTKLKSLKAYCGKLTTERICMDLSMLAQLEYVEIMDWPFGGAEVAQTVLKALSTAPNLSHVKIWNYPVEALADEIGALSNLRILDLSLSTQLRSLPEGIGRLKNLQELNFSGDRKKGWMRSPHPDGPEPEFTGLPDGLRQLSLQKLNLSRISFYNDPKRRRELRAAMPNCDIDFGKWNKLDAALGAVDCEVVNLNGLGLNELPPQLFEMVNLRKLDASTNNLKALPAELGALKQLEVLNLNKNKLTALGPVIGEFTNLKELILGHYFGGGQANLTTLPPEIGKLTKLKELWACGLSITHIPPEIALLKDNLEKLFLYADDGDYIHSNPICGNPEELDKLRAWLPNTMIVYK